MHSLVCGFILAVMALFPGPAGEGRLNLRAWMEAYETHLYQQMEENFEREERERNADNCQNPTESEVWIEQTASEETQEELYGSIAGESVETHTEVPTEASTVERTEEHIQPTQAVAEVAQDSPLYQVNGAVLDIGVQEYLYQRLCEANIGWFYHYAILIAYQESRFDPLAVNPNGKDFGLFQFRLQYHPDLDWANPYAQVDRFVLMMANRAANGKTAAEMISAHNQSDYGPYCQEYVSIVMSHEAGMVQIR